MRKIFTSETRISCAPRTGNGRVALDKITRTRQADRRTSDSERDKDTVAETEHRDVERAAAKVEH